MILPSSHKSLFLLHLAAGLTKGFKSAIISSYKKVKITKGNLMRIGIDIDNTINENKNTVSFFSFLTNALRGNVEIFIITNRDLDSEGSTKAELDKMGIYYDHLEITAEKADFILDNGITVYFDDTDEYFLSLPESVTVFKIREAGNFDFSDCKWVYGPKTGKQI